MARISKKAKLAAEQQAAEAAVVAAELAAQTPVLPAEPEPEVTVPVIAKTSTEIRKAIEEATANRKAIEFRYEDLDGRVSRRVAVPIVMRNDSIVAMASLLRQDRHDKRIQGGVRNFKIEHIGPLRVYVPKDDERAAALAAWSSVKDVFAALDRGQR